ncbi:helix-turn-helix domain-containing protein [Streptomyces sp. NBC_01260]|uniref:PucR family transcriptional regulator n=1 Tax=unclassified Streptomyces TaxID=2593676 RepID=UPI000FBED4A7|nr:MULTISPECIES: helix-turn-helix domain-containing protein [unclassified Streptomyces]RPK38376.1 carbohydrate diacid transcriptional activator CdaR [Streptomyces sp. ADI92-24]
MAVRRGDLTAAVVARCAAEVPFYGELPRSTLDGEVARSIAAVHDLLLRALRDGGVMDPGDLTRLIEWSGRRAEERVPLEAVIAAYLIGAEVWWQVLTETAEPEELAGAGARLLACLHSAMPAVVLAHRNAQEDIHSEDKRVRRALLTALLAGRPYEELAEAAAVTVTGEHEVVALAFESNPPARLVQSSLDARAGVPVLMDHVAGIALLPAGCEVPDLPASLGKEVGQRVFAAAAPASAPTAVPAAAAEATRVLELVQRLGRPPGLYRLDDVLLEYQLARPGDALVRLAAKLGPLEEHPYLLETLRVFVDRGHNRRQSALELCIHRNTLDYRLHRVSTLTGLDLSVPAEARLLQAALVARDLA